MEADSSGPERPHQCNYCPKKYLRKNNLEDHILTDHPESDKAAHIIEYKARHGRSRGNLIIACEICSKRFRYQSDLKNHVESHFRGKGRLIRNGPVGVPNGGGEIITSSPVPNIIRSVPKPVTQVPQQPLNPSPAPPMPLIISSSNNNKLSKTFEERTDMRVEKNHLNIVPGRNVLPKNFRTRPCLYCGKTFFSNHQLKQHEEVEAKEFEKDALDFECKDKVNNVVLEESALPSQSHEIDRTDEEFGGWPTVNHHQNRFYPIEFRYNNNNSMNNNSNNSIMTSRTVQTDSINSTRSSSIDSNSREQHSSVHYNHTSQYVSEDPTVFSLHFPNSVDPNLQHQLLDPPPPAHEDHGFLPPPPPLPVPQFSQPSLNTPHVSDYPAPSKASVEPKIYTLLESSGQTHPSSLMTVDENNSTSLEVLDLSLPKQGGDCEIILEKVEHDSSLNLPSQSNDTNDSECNNDQVINLTKVVTEEKNSIDAETKMLAEPIEESDDITDVTSNVKEEDGSDSPTSNQMVDNKTIEKICKNEEKSDSIIEDEIRKEDALTETLLPSQSVPVSISNECTTFKYEPEAKDNIVTIDPSNLPSMPQVNITFAPEIVTTFDQINAYSVTNGSNSNTTKTSYRVAANEYDGLMNNEETSEWDRSHSPLQFDDPNRLDCKFCGMIFDAAHSRKFHEAGHHDDQHNEYHGDDTRLYCGWCGKTFKKVAYRILHEKGHTGELTINCRNCGKGFRWESELKLHSVSCAPETPTKQRHHVSKHIDKEDWIENHPSMPVGWKLRSRPRPNQEGQRFFIFLSPEGQVFYSRKSMLLHMEKTGGYSLEDLEKVRKSTKAALRGLDTHKSSETNNPSNELQRKVTESKSEGKKRRKLKDPSQRCRKLRIGANA